MVSDLSYMAIKGYFSISILSSTQALLTILAKFLQDRLGAANVILWLRWSSRVILMV